MLARKCDRCGALYPHYYGNKRASRANGFRFLDSWKDGEHANGWEHYDLCPACMGELEAWVERGKEDAE